jgi:hypothetical protein
MMMNSICYNDIYLATTTITVAVVLPVQCSSYTTNTDATRKATYELSYVMLKQC